MQLMYTKGLLGAAAIVIVLAFCSYLVWESDGSTSTPPLTATSTDAPQNVPAFPSADEVFAEVTTSTLSSFSFEYPAAANLRPFTWEGVTSPNNANIVIPTDRGSANIFLFTTLAPLSSINPGAKTLSDYGSDYPISATSTEQVLVGNAPRTINVREEVRILSTESVVINGIPMLKQRYSLGHWSLDENGDTVFKDDSEAEVHNELRYVFSDGKNFIIITGWQDDSYIERIAESIHIINR